MAVVPDSTTMGRKLVVIDLDKTICDFAFQQCPTLEINGSRPFLIYFLSAVFKYFNIMIWSATDSASIQDKLEKLGVLTCTDFKIQHCLDFYDMVVVESDFGSVRVKLLDVIWTKYPMYDRTNTIIIDDQFQNFLKNPNNGVQIKPYFNCMCNIDNELALLSTYLRKLAIYSNDFSSENHKKWKHYKPDIE